MTRIGQWGCRVVIKPSSETVSCIDKNGTWDIIWMSGLPSLFIYLFKEYKVEECEFNRHSICCMS